MTPDEIRIELAAIGWTGAEFARQAGVDGRQVLRWLHAEYEIPEALAAWLRDLAECHRQRPAPRKTVRWTS